MKRLGLFLGMMVLGAFAIVIKAQVPVTSSDELWKVLDAKVQKKLIRADKLMQKAFEYNTKIEFYEKQIEAIRNEGKGLKFRKVEKLERQRNATVVKSSPYFEDAYTYSYKAMTKQIAIMQRQGSSDNVAALTTKAKERYREGKKMYHKAGQTEKAKRQTEMVVFGSQLMRESLKLQVEAVGLLLKKSYNQQVDVPETAADTLGVIPAQSDSLSSSTIAETIILPTDSIKTPLPVEVVEAVDSVRNVVVDVPVNFENALDKVYLAIQIMASTTKATEQQIKMVYNGSLPVTEIASGDNYRYVIGKFSSVENAKSTMTQQGIKGFVVAFKGNERITVNEAILELSGTK